MIVCKIFCRFFVFEKVIGTRRERRGECVRGGSGRIGAGEGSEETDGDELQED